ncbi:MAG: multidrug ABC transporter ATP-binding protein [Rhodospirillaceae bacterium BRH_c57]|nr:MAG: multidrug ABC transporter ATP-binding protein [Rhodospirillaceae bacterium BRH_c57]
MNKPVSAIRPSDAAVSAAPDNAITIEGLTKTYRPRGGQPAKTALNNVSLSVPRGSFFGLLGPNGAGKSTLINIMAGLVMKSAGSVRIWDADLDVNERRARLAIGVVPQELNLDPFFTARELLEVQAGLYGVPKAERRTEEILRSVGLLDKADAYARTLSGGMRRRLLVAKAMVHTPPILVLDEPTAGVDIELRKQLWEQVKAMNARGTTILLTTHYLEEAEELCDRIAIINHGEVVACDTTRALLNRLDNKALTVTVDRAVDAVPDALAAFGAEVAPGGHGFVFRYRPSATNIADLLGAVGSTGHAILDLSTEEADLEDIFLQITRSGGGA